MQRTRIVASGLALGWVAGLAALATAGAAGAAPANETEEFIRRLKAASAAAAARSGAQPAQPAAQPAAAAPAPAAASLAPVAAVLDVEAGTHKLVREPAGVERVAVGNPAIADVSVINRRELLVTGKQLGITSLHIWSAGQVREYKVRVVAVKDPLAKPPAPEFRNATIEPGRSVDGSLPNLLAHRRARQQAATAGKEVTDTSGIVLESQVMTDIKIAEVSRKTLQQYGLNLLKSTANTLAGLGPPGVINSVQAEGVPYAPFGSGSGLLPIQNAFNLVIGDPSAGILGVLSLLESKGLARTLAEPSLVAMSGQSASFLAGGEFPVPVSQGSTGGITIQYKEFGVRLTLSPTVLSKQRIALKVAPEVSDLNFAAAISIGGVAVPSLTVRRTDTTVELGDGESFVISGLVSSNLLSNVDKVPWLGDIPVLGAFFKSSRLSREDKELIMVVTPHLVRPMAANAKQPKTPGSEFQNYRPTFGRMVFTESGDFRTPDTGFSR